MYSFPQQSRVLVPNTFWVMKGQMKFLLGLMHIWFYIQSFTLSFRELLDSSFRCLLLKPMKYSLYVEKLMGSNSCYMLLLPYLGYTLMLLEGVTHFLRLTL